ncbi:MAG: hypothetical protein NTW29_02575 [Bacteroidetes bacterium]|nr:hypothetical protein [Bacteroidota bacterium]
MKGEIVFIVGIAVAAILCNVVLRIQKAIKKVQTYMVDIEQAHEVANELTSSFTESIIHDKEESVNRSSQEGNVIKKTGILPMPAYFIGRQLANQRIKKYLSEKYILLSDEMKSMGRLSEETRSMWYTRDFLENLLTEMFYYNANGVRFYYGQFEDDDTLPTSGQLCLIPILTRLSVDGVVRDIILEDQPDFAERISMPRDANFTLTREFNSLLLSPPISMNHENYFPFE